MSAPATSSSSIVLHSFCGAPSRVVIRSPGRSPARHSLDASGHERDVHVRALDARPREHVGRARLRVGRRRDAGRSRRRRELREAGLEHRELAEAAQGLRDVDRPQVADDDLVAAVLRERVDELDEALDAPPVDGGDLVERLELRLRRRASRAARRR